MVKERAASRTTQQEEYVGGHVNASSATPVSGLENATSGYLQISETDETGLFYLFYSQRNLQSGQKPEDIPIVIWLQGGPGWSS